MATNEFPLLIQASIVKAILGESYIMTLQDYLSTYIRYCN